MKGLVQDFPLLCQRIIEHAARQHGERRVISYGSGHLRTLSNYATVAERARQISKRLLKDGISAGDRVATLAASTIDHLECWYGIAGMGAIYHPVNPRLFADEIVYIINAAEDRLIFVDFAFVPLLEQLADRLPSIARVVVFMEPGQELKTSLQRATTCEDWLSEADQDFEWLTFDETSAAGLFFTSGTTGRPKGALYSHRSIVLMSLAANSPDMYGFTSNDVVLQVVPMCHANGWSWPFSAPMAGASLVLPGPKLDPAALSDILLTEGITCTGGVPTVWQGVLSSMRERNVTPEPLRRLYIGGSPCPRTTMSGFMELGVEVRSAFGMTELGPMGAICSLSPETRDLDGEALLDVRQMQGRPPFLVEFRLEDDEGIEKPWDGRTPGNLKARGACVVSAYYGDAPGQALDGNGYFDTGDIATINQAGYVCLTDRAKDLVKSGGEWISSVDLENHVLGHPAIQHAAVIGASHPKWDERPLLIAVPKDGACVAKDELLQFLESRVAKWWIPDDVIFVDSLPYTATGKIHKVALRALYQNHFVGNPGS